MNNLTIRYIFLIAVFASFSCVSHKKVTLFQNKTVEVGDTLYQMRFAYKIQPRDVLFVSITSYNQKATDFFNVKTSAETDDPVGVGYKVSEEGYITIPILDSVSVKGLSVHEVQQKIALKLKDYISDAYVLVDLANFNFTVLGDVKSPGMKTVLKDKTTLIEAIAMGGDFADYGNRRIVKLIRTAGSNSVSVQLDFTDITLINSPYYYIMPNDVIYVEPLKAKIVRSNLSQVTLLVSLTSLAVVLINIVGR